MTALLMRADTIGSTIVSWLNELNAKYQKRKEIKRTMKELSALDDRALWDMGITRGDIYSVAHGNTDDIRRTNENTNLKGWV